MIPNILDCYYLKVLYALWSRYFSSKSLQKSSRVCCHELQSIARRWRQTALVINLFWQADESMRCFAQSLMEKWSRGLFECWILVVTSALLKSLTGNSLYTLFTFYTDAGNLKLALWLNIQKGKGQMATVVRRLQWEREWYLRKGWNEIPLLKEMTEKSLLILWLYWGEKCFRGQKSYLSCLEVDEMWRKKVTWLDMWQSLTFYRQ